MKVIKCKCGQRIPVQDLTGSLYTVTCRSCGLKVLDIFTGKKGEPLQGKEQIVTAQEKAKGQAVPGYWGK